MRSKKVIYALCALCFAAVMTSCRKDGGFEPRTERKLMLLYLDGFNNLTGNMKGNLRDIYTGAPARIMENQYKLLVMAHFVGPSGYGVPNAPVLMDVYRDEHGNVVCDTLNKTFRSELAFLNNSTNTASGECIYKVWEFIADKFPSSEYGMVFSSHGTGWLPEEYYSTKVTEESPFLAAPGVGDRPSYNPFLDGEAFVKSLGCQAWYDGDHLRTHEIEIADFASAFPIHLRYIILDACLMGGVETYYQLRNAADYVVGSCEEVYASGFYYKNMLNRLFYSPVTDLAGVCDDYVTHSSSATVALVDCSRLEALASAAKVLFAKYETQIARVNGDLVQRYYRSERDLGPRWWFYDMADILRKAGAYGPEADVFMRALENCVVFKRATPRAIGGYPIENYCGMSMYLPNRGDADLDAFYSELDWNIATSLVK